MTVEKVSPQQLVTSGQVREHPAVDQVRHRADSNAIQTIRPQEEVEISAQAKEMARLRAMVAHMPDFRSHKVDELRQKVEAGTYHVPAIEVARKMLEG